MTDRLRQTFNMADDSPKIKTEVAPSKLTYDDAVSTLDKIRQALPSVTDLDQSDIELDEIAQLATDTFTEITELAMQVDSRFAAQFFDVGTKLLGHALDAKTAKINKRLKILDLQLKQAALEKKQATEEPPEGQPVTAKTYDRNELLKAFQVRKEHK